jgi:uncharacterized FAD-dependent dehydrogenase
MQKIISLKLLPHEAADTQVVKKYIALALQVKEPAITGFYITKQSIDARGKQTWVHLTLNVFMNEPAQQRNLPAFSFKDVHTSGNKVIIIGAGPAGLFAALKLIEAGIKPVILERGKDVRSRRRDLAILNKEGIINPESNYCFGEGGAGTYSDGKLYTRSSKRGDVNRILQLFVHFGAEENILYKTHPHIGTNKLPAIITAMRKLIVDCGGEILFEKKVIDFIINKEKIKAVKTTGGDLFEANAFILATGHSARDIFQLLHSKNIQIEAKDFALGVRIEHPQSLIDSLQYHCPARGDFLPPASYSLVQQAEGKGVFSFCMCPGGIIAPAATAAGELVVNGWSPSKRNNPYANSGIVVTIDAKDIAPFKKYGPLAGMYYQQAVEQKAFEAGGGKFAAPAQRMADFCDNKISASLPACSYLPGIHSAALNKVLPSAVHKSLQQAFREFGKKMKGYYTNEAVIVATESRTSSPVRIPRNNETLQHPELNNLYPCGEGAGYAGGIVSAAMDGERVAQQIITLFKGS